MMAMRPLNSLLATIVAGTIALGAVPAGAGRVQDAVASLKDALADLSVAESFYGSESDPSILSGLTQYTGSLRLPPRLGSKVLDAYVDTTSRRDRRTLVRALTGNVRETTGGSGNAKVLRDLFYIEFIGSIRRLTGSGIELRTQLALLFGFDTSARLLERYRLAVSRTK